MPKFTVSITPKGETQPIERETVEAATAEDAAQKVFNRVKESDRVHDATSWDIHVTWNTVDIHWNT